MIDLHTHILCGIDDGAPDAETSLQLLRMEQAQGVDTVVLTPHFYRHREEPGDFLSRRQTAMANLTDALAGLPEEERNDLPRLLVGAEVTWVPNLHECTHLEQMTLNGSEYLLLELPYAKWNSAMVEQIYDLMTVTGLTPVLAHLDRYYGLQTPQMMREVMDLELPIQLSAEGFLHFMSRGRGLKLLRQCAHVVASDCHDLTGRKPNLGEAMELIEKKLGSHVTKIMDENARSLVGE